MKKARIKVNVVAAVLLVGVLCAGTLTAKAGGEYCMLENHYVGGETYAKSSTDVGMARTVSSSYAVHTGVHANYEYYDSVSGNSRELTGSAHGFYGSEVTFSLPSGGERASKISAEHHAEYNGQNWTCTTEAYFEEQ